MAKNVVITGATSGIGEAIARAYLEQGGECRPNRATDRQTRSSQVGVCRNVSKSNSLDLSTGCHGYDHGQDCLLRYFGNDSSD